MHLTVTPATEDDREVIAELAARAQARPDRHIPYVGSAAHSIALEVGEVDDWEAVTTVARSGERLIGWLLAETDADVGRAWLWGPFVDEEHDWAVVADAVYVRAVGGLPLVIAELELAGDERHVELALLAGRHGFVAGVASAVLSLRSPFGSDDERVRTVAEPDRAAVALLHDQLFPGTHTPGSQLGQLSDRSLCFVAEVEGSIAGYAVGELQPDRSGQIEFVGVNPAARRRRLGSALVVAITDELFTEGANVVHLTVREDNDAARRLYAMLDFTEERLVRPYRKGFTLA